MSTAAPTDASTAHRVVFAYLAAMACFHHYPWAVLTRTPDVFTVTAALSLAAIVAVLWRPDDLRALAALGLTQLLDVAVSMPVVPNHWLLTALASLTLLVSFASTRGAHGTLGRIREPMAWGIAIFYLYTGIWKLTAEWFDPSVSCGALSWDRLGAQFGLATGDTGRTFAIYVTLIIELLGPIGLVWRRTRGVVTALFVAFHLVLGLDIIQNYLNFSSVMMALLVLGLDDQAAARVQHLLPALRSIARWWTVPLLVVVVTSAFPDINGLHQGLRWFSWLFHALTAVSLYILMAGGGFPARASLPVAWGFLVAVLLNGASPWLGLKTRNSWQMYSNLRMEADFSNHVFLPASLDLLGYLDDPVTVHEVSAESLQETWLTPELQVTWYTFHNTLADHPEASVRYTRAGTEHQVDRVGDDPELMGRSPWLVRKFVWFRPLGPAVADTCQW